MRILFCCLVVGLFVTCPVTSFAQEKSPFEYDTAVKKTSRVQPRVGLPPERVAELLQQRAMRAAEERRARIESRNWSGVSLMRPNLHHPVRIMSDGMVTSAWWWGVSAPYWGGHFSR